MFDKTYCANSSCPFKDCERHLYALKDIEDKSRMISIANFDGTCRKYIGHVLDELAKKNESP